MFITVKSTEHIVEPDVPADGVVRILLPAGPGVPQPGLVEQDPDPADEATRVKEEPPAALAKLGHPCGHFGSPSVSVPSLNLNLSPLLCCCLYHHTWINPKITCISERPDFLEREQASPFNNFLFEL